MSFFILYFFENFVSSKEKHRKIKNIKIYFYDLDKFINANMHKISMFLFKINCVKLNEILKKFNT